MPVVEMRSYVELSALAELVLEESFVLSITARPAELVFDLDLCLTEGHPSYVPPLPGEWACFRRGSLRFLGVESLSWEGQGTPPGLDATGEVDYGHIDSFAWDGDRHILEGDWGRIEVVAETVEVALADPNVELLPPRRRRT